MEATLKQTQYATVVALNRTGEDVQAEVRRHVQSVFTVRQKQFMLRTVKIPRGGFATKAKPRTEVQIDPERNHLAKFEGGGEKVSLQGKPYVAIPSRDIRRTKKGLVPRSLYLGAFRPFGRASGLRGLGRQRELDVGQKDTWFTSVSTSAGAGRRLLLQRTGKKRVRALYLFVPSVRIDHRLEFLVTARRVIARKFSRNFHDALAGALRTATR